MIATARTATLIGVEARGVRVEADVGRGLPSFALVGLPDAAVRESRERVRSALVNSGFDFPEQRITVSLAPADLRKAGPGLDLAIATAVLIASGQIGDADLGRTWLAGELGLDGAIRPIPGALPIAEAAARGGAERVAVPSHNAAEAALAGAVEVIPLERLESLRGLPQPIEPRRALGPAADGGPDIEDLRGQPVLRRSLEIAAAGGHGVLISGPPGAGKSLAARRLPSILPPLQRQESIEVSRIDSARGVPVPAGGRRERPFRAPHHTISSAGLVGGGNPPRPGEITLAHHGVLFLDELGEFRRDALEALREPLEEGRVTVVRAGARVEFPAEFQLIAAGNPCPCGRGERGGCRCRPDQVERYRARISGALADRIDISVAVAQPSAESMAGDPGEASAAVRGRVIEARERQAARLGPGRTNARMEPGAREAARIGAGAAKALADGHERLGLSGRGHERVLRVARTIADLDGSTEIAEEHVGEALGLRRRTAPASR